MAELFDVSAWREVLIGSFSELGHSVAAFLPNLVGALLILAAGWLVSRALEAIVRRGLRRLGLDRVEERLRLSEALGRAAATAPPSYLAGRVTFWVLMLTFLVPAVETLGLEPVRATIDRLLGYLPNVLGAALILLLGVLLGRLARSLATSGAAAANLPEATRVGMITQTLVVLFLAILAVEQLGVETELLVTVITAIVAGISLSLGLTFALGARPLVTHILAGHFLRQTLPAGTALEISGREGIVERIGQVSTLMRDGERTWTIANARLLEETTAR